jgi:hypothetical protein
MSLTSKLPARISLLCLLALSASKLCAQSNGSVYLSAGYNEAWYGKSTIQVQQPDLNNNYNIENAKGNNQTHTTISPLELNYRLGYYFDYEQKNGVELNFDPVNYQVANGPLTLAGTINNRLNATQPVIFSPANELYYRYTGANLLLLNYVRRIQIYRPDSKKIGVDVLGKIGAGPVLPHVMSQLGGPANDGGQFQFCGWNAGAEAALRVTVYRYIYVEVAGKYDYAMMSSLPVYEGTAKQNLQTYEVIGSLGFTFPTSKRNPLFYREHKIVTILPLFLQKQGKGGDEADDKHKRRHKGAGGDDADTAQVQDIPEFASIVDRDKRKAERQAQDSLTRAKGMGSEDSLLNSLPVDPMSKDSTRLRDSLNRDSVQHAQNDTGKKHKRHRKHDDEATTDSTKVNSGQNTGMAPPENKPNVDSMLNAGNGNAPAKAATPDTAASQPKLSKKELKKLRKEQKQKEKEEEKERKKKEKETAETPPPPPTSTSDSTGSKGN